MDQRLFHLRTLTQFKTPHCGCKNRPEPLRKSPKKLESDLSSFLGQLMRQIITDWTLCYSAPPLSYFHTERNSRMRDDVRSLAPHLGYYWNLPKTVRFFPPPKDVMRSTINLFDILMVYRDNLMVSPWKHQNASVVRQSLKVISWRSLSYKQKPLMTRQPPLENAWWFFRHHQVIL